MDLHAFFTGPQTGCEDGKQIDWIGDGRVVSIGLRIQVGWKYNTGRRTEVAS